MVDTSLPHKREPFKMIPCHILSDASLSKNARLVYPVIADEVRLRGECKLGWTRIGKACGLERRCVHRGIEELIERGIIVEKKTEHGRANWYHIGTGTKSVPVPKEHQSTSTKSVPVVVPKEHQLAPIIHRESNTKKYRSTYTAKASFATPTEHDEKDLLGEAIKPTEPKPREPNPVWDAICDLWGIRPVTRSDMKRIGLLTRDYKAKLNGSGVDEIARRREHHRLAWPKVEASPESVLKHWDRFAKAPRSTDELRREAIAKATREALKDVP
jgi:hypothetical protein